VISTVKNKNDKWKLDYLRAKLKMRDFGIVRNCWCEVCFLEGSGNLS